MQTHLSDVKTIVIAPFVRLSTPRELPLKFDFLSVASRADADPKQTDTNQEQRSIRDREELI
jgi:hypothetical protein